MTSSILRKEYDRAVCCHPVCLTYLLSTSWEMLGLMSSSWKNINNLKYADDTTVMVESKMELKSFLMRVKEKSERTGLRLNTKKKTMIKASAPISSWQMEGEKVKVGTDFLFLGSKITADGDRSHEIRRRLLLRRTALINLDSVFSSNKGPYRQGHGLPSCHV